MTESPPDPSSPNRLYRDLYRRTPAMMQCTDKAGRLLSVSDFWLEVLGFTRDEVTGTPASRFFINNPHCPDQETFLAELNENGYIRDVPCQMVKKSGETIDVLLSAIADKNDEGQIARVLMAITDVTQRQKVEEQFNRLAHYEPLTGLPNRILMQDRLRQALGHAYRENRKVGIMFLDLDRFKEINDNLGHQAGDMLLKIVAHRLTDCVRQGDTVARIGGDEFVIILFGFASEKDPASFARRFLEVLSQPVQLHGKEVLNTGSIGIAIFPSDGQEVDTLLRKADIAMYAAKKQGRNSYRFFSADMTASTAKKFALESHLRRSLENQELFLVYQPQLDLRTGRVEGFEALLRWRHPEMGYITPAEFIPLAEDSGLIYQLGEWVLKMACTQARTWQQTGFPPFRMAVNVSGRQFNRPDFIEMVEDTLRHTGFDPNLLEMELTESVIMDNIQHAITTLTDLKIRRINLAIDDFGTGYSSLMYLKHFPFDRIKIAQEFVRDIPKDPEDSAIVETIIAMASSLGLDIIAEGVEVREQLEFLHSRRCFEMQGFYFATPATAEDWTRQFRKGFLRKGFCLYQRPSERPRLS